MLAPRSLLQEMIPRTSLPGQMALALAMEPVLSNLVTDVSKSYESHIIYMALTGCQEKPRVCCLAIGKSQNVLGFNSTCPLALKLRSLEIICILQHLSLPQK